MLVLCSNVTFMKLGNQSLNCSLMPFSACLCQSLKIITYISFYSFVFKKTSPYTKPLKTTTRRPTHTGRSWERRLHSLHMFTVPVSIDAVCASAAGHVPPRFNHSHSHRLLSHEFHHR